MLFYAFRGFERVRFMISNLLVYSGRVPGASSVNRTRLGPSWKLGAKTETPNYCQNRTCAWPVADTTEARRRDTRRCEISSQKRKRNGSPATAGAEYWAHLRTRRCENWPVEWNSHLRGFFAGADLPFQPPRVRKACLVESLKERESTIFARFLSISEPFQSFWEGVSTSNLKVS